MMQSLEEGVLCRDAEVLSLFAAIITKLRELMAPEVPRVFEAIFECTLQMITKNFAVGPWLLPFITYCMLPKAWCPGLPFGLAFLQKDRNLLGPGKYVLAGCNLQPWESCTLSRRCSAASGRCGSFAHF